MNRDLAYAFLSLRLSQKRGIRKEMGFGERYAHETDVEYDKRFLTYVHHEGKIRTLEQLVDEYEKQN